jgi:lipoprotein-anchoring transpeptidase ErfK/SrfK
VKGRCIVRWRWLSLFFCSFLLILFLQNADGLFLINNLHTAYASVQSNPQAKTLSQKYCFADNEQPTTPSSIDIEPSNTPIEDKNPDVIPGNETPKEVTPPAITLPVVKPKPVSPPIKNPPVVKPPVVKPPAIKPTVKKENTPLTNGLDKNTISKTTLETLINSKNLSSKTKYLIWINTITQRTYIFTKAKDSWVLLKTFICATGKDSTPTIKGVFKTEAKASWVYDKKYNCYLKYVTKIFQGYLMHSVILDKNGHITDGTLGRKKSHGCVRLSIADSEWIYKNLPLGTTIFIN